MDELLTQKELAARLKRNPHYVSRMKSEGFKMQSGLTTLERAYRWLEDNGRPYAKKRRRRS